MARKRLVIEVESGSFYPDELELAIATRSEACLEMPGWGSAVQVVIVEVLPDGP